MKRRDFLAVAAAAPFAGFTINPVTAVRAELLPHRLLLPAEAWQAIAFAAAVTKQCRIIDGFVTDTDARIIAAEMNGNWEELSRSFSLYLGICPNDTAESWLLGRYGRQNTRTFEAFARAGAFQIVEQGDDVLLVRADT